MPYHWKPGYSVGDTLIDEQHRQLLELANMVLQARESEGGDRVVGRAFRALSVYTAIHFEAEERLFADIGSPLAAEQKKQHGLLTAELKQIWTASQMNLLDDVLDSLIRWLETRLIRHMIEDDQKARWGHLRAQTVDDEPCARSSA